ncbi:50S ribosomal protein L18 [bacterium]|nr:50S ribosomal protein L18 [bacterium]
MKLLRKQMSERQRRQKRIRRRITGTPERPRLAVFRSLRYIYAQLIDDTTGTTLASATTAGKKAPVEGGTGNVAAAKYVGKAIAEAAKAAGISAVVLDRAGYRYHGRVKALADAAREGGLQF